MIKKVENKSQVDGTTWWPSHVRLMVKSTPKAHLKEMKQNGGDNYHFLIQCKSPEIAHKLSALMRALDL